MFFVDSVWYDNFNVYYYVNDNINNHEYDYNRDINLWEEKSSHGTRAGGDPPAPTLIS